MAADDYNPLLSALLALRAQLRDCFYWRALGGVTPFTQQQAEDRIYFDELPPPLDNKPDYSAEELTALRPLALMWLDLNGGIRLRSETGANCCWIASGAAIVQIELTVPINLVDDPRALAIDLHTKIGRIIRTGDALQPGLCDLSGLPGYLPIKDVLYRGYVRTDDKAAIDIGDAVRCELEVQWSAE